MEVAEIRVADSYCNRVADGDAADLLRNLVQRPLERDRRRESYRGIEYLSIKADGWSAYVRLD